MKTIDSLTAQDIAESAVWKFSADRQDGELTLRPIRRLPVSNLTGKIVGTRATLANGTQVWAIFGNIDSDNPRLTEHFLTISVERDGAWFHLARYHDFDYEERGPLQLAGFLQLRVSEVFPISFDLRAYALGDPRALSGFVREEPVERLSLDEIIALAVP